MSEELTNLNWLSLTPIEIDKCQSDEQSSTGIIDQQPLSCDVIQRLLCEGLGGATENDLLRAQVEQERIHRRLQRPRCSYSCLIAMALKASESGCLPVHLIYKYIEQEFPFFETAPEGWKNSIRHNLSMNQNFVKVSKDDVQAKKGFSWAISPGRMDVLDQEIEKTLKTIGRKLNENGQLQSDQIPVDDLTHLTPSSAEQQTLHSYDNLLSDHGSDHSIDSLHNIGNSINLDTLNSIVGLETRGRADQNSKFELHHVPLERQTSLEAAYSLFGVSFAPQEYLHSSCSSYEELTGSQSDGSCFADSHSTVTAFSHLTHSQQSYQYKATEHPSIIEAKPILLATTTSYETCSSDENSECEFYDAIAPVIDETIEASESDVSIGL